MPGRLDFTHALTPRRRRFRPPVRIAGALGLALLTLAVLLGPSPATPRAHAAPPPPVITFSDYYTQGSACPNCRVDLYSNGPGANYYGAVRADNTGFWTTAAPAGLPQTYSFPVGGSKVYATATDGTGTSAPSALFAARCSGPVCVSGQYESTYLDSVSHVLNHCTSFNFQLGNGASAGAITGSIDCTTAHGGSMVGTFDQATLKLDVILSYTSTAQKYAATGTMNSDASAGSGTWDCFPASCGGPYPWSTVRKVPVTADQIRASTGGTITDDLGDTLDIPANALCGGDTTIQVETVPLLSNEPLPSGVHPLTRAFVGEPTGTSFTCGAPPFATITIHYTDDDIAFGQINPASLVAMVWDSVNARWTYIGGTVNTLAKTITFTISHFTDYGIFDCTTGLADTDLDGIGNICDPDDDNDALADDVETNTGVYVSPTDRGTDPLKADTDLDTLPDGSEVNVYGTNPVMTDTDGDALKDGEEVITYFTDPTKADTDLDGLSDGAEVISIGTLPTKYDTDFDGCGDGVELGPSHTSGGQRDPLTTWDFYDVPAPALRLGYTGQVLDHGIGLGTDVLALLAYSGMNAASPDYLADYDANGIKDGQQYDRSVSSTPGQPWRSGPPDGGIGLGTDVLAMLAQTGNTCS